MEVVRSHARLVPIWLSLVSKIDTVDNQIADRLEGWGQNLKRVRPPGSVPNTTVAERGSMRYTCHGGGP